MRSRSLTYKKTLIFLCDNYPLSAREFFIDDEMRVIAPRFEKVILYTASAKSNENLNRFIPDNAEIVQFSKQKLEVGKIKSFFRIFKPMFLRELAFGVHKLPVKYWVSAFKIMYVDIHRASNLKNELLQFCNHSHLNVSNCVFYSYWHDYKALALAMLRKSFGCACVARAHRWDNFAEVYPSGYLPFKKYIIHNLSQTYTISQKGKDSFEKYLNKSLDDMVTVSRLGKFNERPVQYDKVGNQFLICSCSDIRADKRVDKIIDVISLMKTPNIKWVHIGDDKLRQEIECYAANKLKKSQYEFLGLIPNPSILDYYSTNYVDLFINLSTSEGIPVSVMEAMSAGIPVLATNVGGTSEIVNKSNGFLVDENINVVDVAKIIDEYLAKPEDSRREYRKNAYDFWKENFEAERNYNIFGSYLLSIE